MINREILIKKTVDFQLQKLAKKLNQDKIYCQKLVDNMIRLGYAVNELQALRFLLRTR